MTTPRVLADKSALEQVRHSAQATATVLDLIDRGSLATCEAVALEVLYSARNLAEYRSTKAQLLDQPWLSVDRAASARALQVQELLAERGMHRMAVLDLSLIHI